MIRINTSQRSRLSAARAEAFSEVIFPYIKELFSHHPLRDQVTPDHVSNLCLKGVQLGFTDTDHCRAFVEYSILFDQRHQPSRPTPIEAMLARVDLSAQLRLNLVAAMFARPGDDRNE